MVKLRDMVVDTITGVTGVVVARCEYLNGCVRCDVQPKGLNKDGEPFKSHWVDEGQLEIGYESSEVPSLEATGGPRDNDPVRLTPPSS